MLFRAACAVHFTLGSFDGYGFLERAFGFNLLVIRLVNRSASDERFRQGDYLVGGADTGQTREDLFERKNERILSEMIQK
jgi:hypothetical protein